MSIKQNIYDFKKISDVELCAEKDMVDIVGIVCGVGDVTEFTSKKSGKDMVKCDLTICDDSNCEIKVTLWGEKARSAPDDVSV